MNVGKEIVLNWQGPLEAGNLPRKQSEIDNKSLENPGVYVILQNFEQFTAGYGGKTFDLRNRLHDHLGNFLAFKYAIRQKNPSLRKELYRPANADWSDEYVFWKPDEEGLNCFNDLLTWVPRAIREIKNLQFYYCRYPDEGKLSDLGGDCDLSPKEFTKWMEGHLVYHLKNCQGEEKRFVCDNQRFPVANFSKSPFFKSQIKNKFNDGQDDLEKIMGNVLKSPKA